MGGAQERAWFPRLAPSWNTESVREIVTCLSSVGSSATCPVLFFVSGFHHMARELVGLYVMT